MTTQDEQDVDISHFEGSHHWWTTVQQIPEFANSAQDPTFSYSLRMSPDMHAEHIFNSVVEARYLMDTGKVADD